MARVYPHSEVVKPTSNKKGKGPKEAKGGSAPGHDGEQEQKEGEGE